MRHLLFGCAAAIAAAMLPAPATAAVNTLFFSGNLYDAHDATGLFGVPNGNLGRLPYLLAVTFDTALTYRTTMPGADELFSGTVFGTPSAISDVAITINGITQHFAPNTIAAVTTFAGVGGAAVAEQVGDDGTTTTIDYLLAFGRSASAAGNLDDDLSAIRIMPVVGGFEFGSFDDATGIVTVDTCGNFVPEPATWVMMLAGFGLVGATLRRQRELTRG